MFRNRGGDFEIATVDGFQGITMTITMTITITIIIAITITITINFYNYY